MKITKFGHSCLLIAEGGVRILIDPGSYSTGQNEIKNIDIILITHAHQDHVDIDSLKIVLNNNPAAKIITNTNVGALLEKENIAFTIVEDGQSYKANRVLIEGIGKDHAVIYPSIPVIQNVGYMIAGRFFYPGDALTDPMRPVEILAMPVTAPWMRISEGIDYAIKINPKKCFPVHDGIYYMKTPGVVHRIPAQVLEQNKILFMVLEIGREYDFP